MIRKAFLYQEKKKRCKEEQDIRQPNPVHKFMLIR